MPARDGTAGPRPPRRDADDERLTYGEVLVEIGEIYDAEAEVTALLEERPDDLTALDLLAKVKHMRGEISAAIACWAQIHERAPREQAALLRLSALLQLARETGRAQGAFVAIGPFQLWRKPAAHMELEGVFRLFLDHKPDEARARCEELARKYRARDPDVYKLAVLANAWIAELSGDLDSARSILESFGRDRGYETDSDRVLALARLYEQIGTPDLLEKAVNVYLYFARKYEKVSVLGHLASLCRKLGRVEEAGHYEGLFEDLFRRRMHRPSFAAVAAAAARRYLPLYKLAAVRFPEGRDLSHPSPRERAVLFALEGDIAGARRLLEDDGDVLALKYRGDLHVLEGATDEAVRVYLECLGRTPDDLRLVEWLLSGEEKTLSRPVRRYFLGPAGPGALERLDAALHESPLRPSLWRSTAALHAILGRPEDAARHAERADILAEAAGRARHPVGRVLAAAVYHFVGKPRGIVHEIWAARRPSAAGRGGFLEEILGNLTPEMTQAVRNTFLSVREYARAKWPARTRDILDFTYAYKVTKEDEPSGGLSAGLPTALAFLSVFLDRPVPQTIASSGELVADAHDVLVVRAVGDPEYKVRGAFNRNLEQVLLPEANRAQLAESPLVPEAVSREVVAWVSDLDDAVLLAFGEDIWMV